MISSATVLLLSCCHVMLSFAATHAHADAARHNQSYVAACVSVKDQPVDSREFVDWHHMMGIDMFYFYDNNSTLPLAEVLHDYIVDGVVVVSRFEHFEHDSGKPQFFAYDECIREHRHQHKWLAFLDVDEFIVFSYDNVYVRRRSSKGPSIADGNGDPKLHALLKNYEEFGGLGINWRMICSSNLTHRPLEGAVASFTSCMPPSDPNNLHVKTILNTRFAELNGTRSPHDFAHTHNAFSVNHRYKKIDGPRTSAPPTDDEQVVIYHYVIKSAAEYKAKTARGSGDLGRKGPEFRRHIEAACTCECTQAQDMSRQLGYAWLAKRALDSLGLASEEELGPML